MDKFFLKVLHEEPLDKLTLESIKGGAQCICNNGSLTCACMSSPSYVRPCNCNTENGLNPCSCNNQSLSCDELSIEG